MEEVAAGSSSGQSRQEGIDVVWETIQLLMRYLVLKSMLLTSSVTVPYSVSVICDLVME